MNKKTHNFIKNFSFIFSLIIFLFLSTTNIAKAQDEKISKVEKRIQIITNHIQKKYGVKALYKNIPESVSPKYVYSQAEKKDMHKLLRYLKVFYQELSKYPKSFFKGKDLHSIIFVKKLFLEEKPAEGLYLYKSKQIFFDFSRNESNVLSKRHSIHHEFYHMMDIMQPGWRDPIWNTFNDPEFVYGKESVKNMEKKRGRGHQILRERKGFITPYSMKSAEEDKAEIYACLLIKSQNKILQKWEKDDEILKKKTDYIKNRIEEFCSDMNEKYWETLFRH